MNKIIRKGIILVIVPFILVSIAYAILLLYYQSSIPYGTWINGIYCTGLSLEEADALLQEQPVENTCIIIHTMDESIEISFADYIEYLDYTDNIKLEAITLNPITLFIEKHITISPSVVLMEEMFSDYLKTFDFMHVPNTSELYIEETDEGYILVDTIQNKIDVAFTIAYIIESITSGEDEIYLIDSSCYTQGIYSDLDYETIALFDKLDNFTHTIDFNLYVGDELYPINATILKDWILVDSSGDYIFDSTDSLVLDEAAVLSYVDSMDSYLSTRADRTYQLSTYEREWNFINHDGDEIYVKSGSYGRVLDDEALYEYLINAFTTATSQDYALEFTYYPETDLDIVQGLELPNTYLEVDIEEQHIYMYEDGILIFDSACVTGNLSTNDTPVGVYYIDYMQEGRTLVGDTYRTYVNYWMRFYSLCGFHDATWRSTFGDDIYTYNGSHGCINMPVDKAEELYELAYIGLAVIIY